MNKLPEEIINYIFLYTDFYTCTINNKDYANKLLKYKKNMFYNAIINGNLKLVKWLHYNKKICHDEEDYKKDYIEHALEYEYYDIVKFLYCEVFKEEKLPYHNIDCVVKKKRFRYG